MHLKKLKERQTFRADFSRLGLRIKATIAYNRCIRIFRKRNDWNVTDIGQFRYFRRREGEGRESAENRVSARVFARSNPRGGLTNRGKPRYSSSRWYRCSLYPILFPFSRDNVLKIALFAKSYHHSRYQNRRYNREISLKASIGSNDYSQSVIF